MGCRQDNGGVLVTGVKPVCVCPSTFHSGAAGSWSRSAPGARGAARCGARRRCKSACSRCAGCRAQQRNPPRPLPPLLPLPRPRRRRRRRAFGCRKLASGSNSRRTPPPRTRATRPMVTCASASSVRPHPQPRLLPSSDRAAGPPCRSGRPAGAGCRARAAVAAGPASPISHAPSTGKPHRQLI